MKLKTLLSSIWEPSNQVKGGVAYAIQEASLLDILILIF